MYFSSFTIRFWLIISCLSSCNSTDFNFALQVRCSFINTVSLFEMVLFFSFQVYVREQQKQGVPRGKTRWEPQVAPGTMLLGQQ